MVTKPNKQTNIHTKSSYFHSFCLKCWDYSLDILHKERPWVEQKELVSHYNRDAEPTMETSSLCIFQKECVTQYMTSDFISKEDWTLLPWNNLYSKTIWRHELPTTHLLIKLNSQTVKHMSKMSNGHFCFIPGRSPELISLLQSLASLLLCFANTHAGHMIRDHTIWGYKSKNLGHNYNER